MLKKTALCLTALLLSSSACAKVLVHLNLASEGEELCRQSVIINGTETVSCQLSDLLFDVKATKKDQDVKIALKIFTVVENTRTLVAQPEFKTAIDKPTSLALEKDGKEMRLILVAVDVEE